MPGDKLFLAENYQIDTFVIRGHYRRRGMLHKKSKGGIQTASLKAARTSREVRVAPYMRAIRPV